MNNEIMRTLDALAISTFVDIGKHTEENGDASAEIYYKRAVRAAETIYGAFHGEVGLVLLRLAAYYRRHGRYDEAGVVEERIADILAIYQLDQET